MSLTATDLAKLYAIAAIVRRSYIQDKACSMQDMEAAVDAAHVIERILRRFEIAVQEKQEEGFADYVRKTEVA